ncbi:hypothetical protein LXA43DRAFT_906199, partial [Ganoderma leucocontextum]
VIKRKIRSQLNKLTMGQSDSILEGIIACHWANKSEEEKEGRTPIYIVHLMFEKATHQ